MKVGSHESVESCDNSVRFASQQRVVRVQAHPFFFDVGLTGQGAARQQAL